MPHHPGAALPLHQASLQRGDASPGIKVLGPDVCCGNLPAVQCSFVALGVPIGRPDLVKVQAADRIDAETNLLRKLKQLSALARLLRGASRAAFAPKRCPMQTYSFTLVLTTMLGPSLHVCWATGD